MDVEAAAELCSRDGRLRAARASLSSALGGEDPAEYLARLRALAVDAAREAADALALSPRLGPLAEHFRAFEGSAAHLARRSPLERVPFLLVECVPVEGGLWSCLGASQLGRGSSALPSPLSEEVHAATLLGLSHVHGGLRSLLVLPPEGDPLLEEAVDVAREARSLGIASAVRVPPEREVAEGGYATLGGVRYDAAFATGGPPPQVARAFPDPRVELVAGTRAAFRAVVARYAEEEALPVVQPWYRTAFDRAGLVRAMEGAEGPLSLHLQGLEAACVLRSADDLDTLGAAAALAGLANLREAPPSGHALYPACLERVPSARTCAIRGRLRAHDGAAFAPGVAVAAACRIAPHDYDADALERLGASLDAVPREGFEAISGAVEEAVSPGGRLRMPPAEVAIRFPSEVAEARRVAGRAGAAIGCLLPGGEPEGERTFLLGSERARSLARIAQEREADYARNLLFQSDLVLACVEAGARALAAPSGAAPSALLRALEEAGFGRYARGWPEG